MTKVMAELKVKLVKVEHQEMMVDLVYKAQLDQQEERVQLEHKEM